MSFFRVGGTQIELGQVYDAECQRYRGRFYGSWKACVVDNDDSLKLGRVRVVVPKVLGVNAQDNLIESVWAWPKSSLGGLADVGAVMVPDVGAWCWVEFEEGLPTKPLYSGGWNPGEDAESSTVPRVIKTEGEGDDTPATDKGDDSLSRALGGTSSEPAAPYAAQYPLNRGIRTRAGHVIELDDTEGEERIHVWHRSGSFVEFHKDGTVVWRARDGRRYTLIEKDDDLHVKGDRHEHVEGDHTSKRDGHRKIETGMTHEEEIALTRRLQVGSNETLQIGGSRTESIGTSLSQSVGAQSTETVGGVKTITAPLIKLN